MRLLVQCEYCAQLDYCASTCLLCGACGGHCKDSGGLDLAAAVTAFPLWVLPGYAEQIEHARKERAHG